MKTSIVRTVGQTYITGDKNKKKIKAISQSKQKLDVIQS